MTVKELIEKLKELPQDYKVIVEPDGNDPLWHFTVSQIEVIEDYGYQMGLIRDEDRDYNSFYDFDAVVLK